MKMCTNDENNYQVRPNQQHKKKRNMREKSPGRCCCGGVPYGMVHTTVNTSSSLLLKELLVGKLERNRITMHSCTTQFKKNLSVPKPSEHPPSSLAVETKTPHGIKRVPQCSHIGSTV